MTLSSLFYPLDNLMKYVKLSLCDWPKITYRAVKMSAVHMLGIQLTISINYKGRMAIEES